MLNFERTTNVISFRACVFGRTLFALLAGIFIGLTSARASGSNLTTSDVALLDDLQQHTLAFFLEHSDPVTGLTLDRAPASGAPSKAPASIAASGFALTAWCIADERGWIPQGEALRRVKLTLRFVAEHVQQEHGWFFHYVNASTGRRTWKCEASTIDTALFLQGAICAREYFDDPIVQELVDKIYERIDWQWALNGGSSLSHGWWPESGFIPHRWDSYAEMLGLYLLGLGAPSHALTPAAWHAWSRGPMVTYAGRTFMQCPPLFTHQFSHAYFDFRGRRDDYADYWKNSVDATLAQRDWYAAQAPDFPQWSRDLWGLTSSDSARGYQSWGGPFGSTDKPDGTVVPCAPGGSLPFAPQECLAALRAMRVVGGARVWGRYGFADAFNPQTGWVSPDVLAIDEGIMLVMAENLRSGFVWRNFMRAPEVRRGLKLAGFKRTQSPFQTLVAAVTSKLGVLVDLKLSE